MTDSQTSRATQERIWQLEQRIADAEARLPAHSIPPAMRLELEDLEDELARLRLESEPGGVHLVGGFALTKCGSLD